MNGRAILVVIIVLQQHISYVALWLQQAVNAAQLQQC